MKKLVSMSLAVCMCLSVGVMLTACGHECTYETEWSKDTTHHWHACEGEDCLEISDKAEHTWNDGEITTEATAEADGVKTFTCTVCGQTKTESVQLKTTVTEAEWNNLFVGEALNNVSINMETKLYQTGATEPLQTQNGFSKTTVDSLYQGYYDAYGENLAYEEYLTQKDNKWYHLRKSDNTWIGNEIDSSNLSHYTFSGSQGICFVDKYSAFTYDTENKCYITENFAVTSSSVLDVVKFYVENGKLVKMEFEMTNGTMRQVASYTFSDYGTTVIEVPEWTVAN